MRVPMLDAADELACQAQNGIVLMLRGSTNLEVRQQHHCFIQNQRKKGAYVSLYEWLTILLGSLTIAVSVLALLLQWKQKREKSIQRLREKVAKRRKRKQ